MLAFRRFPCQYGVWKSIGGGGVGTSKQSMAYQMCPGYALNCFSYLPPAQRPNVIGDNTLYQNTTGTTILYIEKCQCVANNDCRRFLYTGPSPGALSEHSMCSPAVDQGSDVLIGLILPGYYYRSNGTLYPTAVYTFW